nr:MAG TPA: hypothetical protein [Caudoviricetes sp.]
MFISAENCVKWLLYGNKVKFLLKKFRNLIKVGEHISLKDLASILSKIWIIIFVHYSKELK